MDRERERKRENRLTESLEPQHPEKSNNICPGRMEGGGGRKRLVPRGHDRKSEEKGEQTCREDRIEEEEEEV